jgi:hypothetical protein
VDTTPFEHDFLIGKPDAPVKLTVAINLYCGPCKNELEKAKDLLAIYPGKVNLTLRLLKSGDKGESSGRLLKTWLGTLKQRNNGLPDGQSLMDAWYEVMDKETFASFHPINGQQPEAEVDRYMQAHYNWVKKADITKTPTTFMNGYELPAAYRVKDLVPLIPGLEDVYIDQKEANKKKENTFDATNSEK